MRIPRPKGTARPTRADMWLVGGLVVMAVAVSLAAPASPPYRGLDAAGPGLALASALCLIWRRTAPELVTVAASLILAANAAAGYAATVVQWPAWIALFTCFSLTGVWWRRGIGVAATVLAVGFYIALDREPAGMLELSGITMCFLIATVGGDAARSRRVRAAAVEARLLSEAREREAHAERVLIEERANLARELHDALGHAVNVMVMQAGVGRRVFADNPSFSHEALTHIETVGREALDELDRLVRVLHPADRTPSADLTDLSLFDLAGRVQAAGRELDLHIGQVDLEAGGARAAYRIVQEAVTNALRHTETGRIRVGVAQEGAAVRIEVLNEGHGFPEPRPGRGLVNMRERAHLEGGEFFAGPVREGFAVRATLPVRAAART
ncbi:hypothetical protein Ssi02_26770 [Sinosporangium siamense]|uniref:histidine kinase n=2 Tax=Sinosporangium siamense TaxID=1367973 RepID=A0A919V6W7_9ACTN|nr:hypothetical protein Ssi02_26770 [Sinosporangium siamense]